MSLGSTTDRTLFLKNQKKRRKRKFRVQVGDESCRYLTDVTCFCLPCPPIFITRGSATVWMYCCSSPCRYRMQNTLKFSFACNWYNLVQYGWIQTWRRKVRISIPSHTNPRYSEEKSPVRFGSGSSRSIIRALFLPLAALTFAFDFHAKQPRFQYIGPSLRHKHLYNALRGLCVKFPLDRS